MSIALSHWRMRLLMVATVLFASFLLAAPAKADTQTDCTTQGYKWCTSSGYGYCNYSTTSPCPASNSSECSAQNGKWCNGTSGGTGWCSSDINYVCPATTEAECKGQGKIWCTMSGSSMPWCTDYCSSGTGNYSYTPSSTTTNTSPTQTYTPPSGSGTPSSGTQTTPTPTIDPKTTCASQGYKWCLNKDGATGWCNYSSSSPCPVYTETDCTAQKGEWCASTSPSGTTYSGSVTGWCSFIANSCPVNDKGTCESKGRKWCTYSSGGVTGGWCSYGTENCPSTATSTPPVAPTAPPITPTTTVLAPAPKPETQSYSYGAWPKDKLECAKYYGKWCGTAIDVGSCYMATKTCPVTPKPGETVCWDNSTMPSGSTCASMPLTEADCSKVGKYWCSTSSGTTTGTTSGWCSADYCTPIPPAGKISCPDGRSVSWTLGGCPRTDGGTAPPPDEYTMCPDGRRIKSPATCTVSYTCKNGKQVSKSEECDKEDFVTQCLNAGGSWCSSRDTQSTGWCAQKDTDCTTETGKTKAKPTDNMLKQFEIEKQNLLNKVNELARYFRRAEDKVSLTKVAALKEQIQKLVPDEKDPNIMKMFEPIRQEITLLYEALNTYNEPGTGPVQDYDLDDAFREKALKQMQQGIASFEKFLLSLDKKIAAAEKKKIPGVQECKKVVVDARAEVQKVRAAKSYEEVREIMDGMPDKAEQLNECLHRLEQLSRYPRAARLVNQQLSSVRQAVARATASAKRVKLDVSDALTNMRQLLTEVEASVKQLKAGTFEGEDLFDFIEEEILDKIADINSIAAGITSIADVKRFTNQVTKDIKRWASLITRGERRKQDMSDAKAMLADLKENLVSLQKLSSKPITNDTADEAIDLMQMISDINAEFGSLFKTSLLQGTSDQIRRSLESGGTTFERAKVDSIENLIVYGYRVANYYRMSPTRNLAFLLY